MLKIVTLRDSKGAFYPTQCVPSVNAWLRVLGDEINSNREQREVWATHPEDFAVFEFGTFDEASGLMALHDKPELVVQLSALLKS